MTGSPKRYGGLRGLGKWFSIASGPMSEHTSPSRPPDFVPNPSQYAPNPYVNPHLSQTPSPEGSFKSRTYPDQSYPPPQSHQTSLGSPFYSPQPNAYMPSAPPPPSNLSCSAHDPNHSYQQVADPTGPYSAVVSSYSPQAGASPYLPQGIHSGELSALHSFYSRNLLEHCRNLMQVFRRLGRLIRTHALLSDLRRCSQC